MSQHSLFDCQRTTNNLLHSALLIQHFNIMKSNNPSYDKREGKDQQWLLHKKNTLIYPPFQCVHLHNLQDIHFEPLLRATFLQIMATFFFQRIHLLLFDLFKMAKSLQWTLNFVPKGVVERFDFTWGGKLSLNVMPHLFSFKLHFLACEIQRI